MNFTFKKPDGSSVDIEAKDKKAAESKFNEKYAEKKAKKETKDKD